MDTHTLHAYFLESEINSVSTSLFNATHTLEKLAI